VATTAHIQQKKNENINVAIFASITFSEVKIKIKKFHCMWKKEEYSFFYAILCMALTLL
jgi:hypothetical protein